MYDHEAAKCIHWFGQALQSESNATSSIMLSLCINVNKSNISSAAELWEKCIHLFINIYFI